MNHTLHAFFVKVLKKYELMIAKYEQVVGISVCLHALSEATRQRGNEA
jgi:hypothetical protein